MQPLQFGVLSTASVNEYAFLPVVKRIKDAQTAVVASRDRKKAAEYAERHGIPRFHGDYDALLGDPKIDCVYIPLPASMHAEWTIKAMESGKHVLCEKPAATNAAEARAIAHCVKKTKRIFAEAFHYRYHPLSMKIEEIVRGGGIGEVRRISAMFGVPLTDKNKVQFKPELAGGALRDIGCYPLSFARWIAGCDEAKVVAARAARTRSGVDGTTRATLEFANGVTAKIRCSLEKLLPPRATIHGTEGDLYILTPFRPAVQMGPVCLDLYFLVHRRGSRIRNIRVPSADSYYCQMDAFRKAVRANRQPLTNAEEAVSNMRLMDAIYRKL